MLLLGDLFKRYLIKDNKEQIALSLVIIFGLLSSQLEEKFMLPLKINSVLFLLFYYIGLLLINFEQSMQPTPKNKALSIVLVSFCLAAYFSSLIVIKILK